MKIYIEKLIIHKFNKYNSPKHIDNNTNISKTKITYVAYTYKVYTFGTNEKRWAGTDSVH